MKFKNTPLINLCISKLLHRHNVTTNSLLEESIHFVTTMSLRWVVAVAVSMVVLTVAVPLPVVWGLGSMSSIAVSYGEKGPVFCSIKSDGSHLAACYGSNPAIAAAAPSRLPFLGLTAGDGFVCGLLRDTSQPYCWGATAYVPMGVPQPIPSAAEYSDIAAGDYHLCALRKPFTGSRRNLSLVDCWGYNMTRTFSFAAQVQSISAGSEFNCGLFSQNRTAFCWGDDASSRAITLVPTTLRFQSIAAGGYHVCGVPEGVDSKPVCWGRSLDIEEEKQKQIQIRSSNNVDAAPDEAMVSVVGGKFHACGIRSSDRRVLCWGFVVEPSTPVPSDIKVYEITAGNYFTCGILAERSLSPICWGSGFPTILPMAVPPGLCHPCPPGFFELGDAGEPCSSRTCIPCTAAGCPPEMYLKSECSVGSDRICTFNCSACSGGECFSRCSEGERQFWAVQLPVVAAEVAFAVLLVVAVAATAVLYVRYRLRGCRCGGDAESLDKRQGQRQRQVEVGRGRARMFGYSELERATGGFSEESLVGRGSFSYVFRGVLEDGSTVAVKRATNIQKSWKEFHTELDLLSRLNHAHLLNLLGFCEEGEERLLVYEYMAHGSLHQHLHHRPSPSSPRLDWVRRVTIAVQAARGIEYLHGYACPPVIHRDIKSSNILIDEEHNARVADFGLSLLGPADSCSPLPELPAGTLGYLDPEYYRLHYLTTKSDVYSFGVLLLEILSGRKAIHMDEAGGDPERAVNLVEWAVPLVKAGEIAAVLDPTLDPPPDPEAVRRIADVACRCVRMRGKERPSMDRVTTALERALALLMGTPCSDQPILPTEVVLGSARLHKKQPSQRSSDSDCEFRAPSWITFPSVASSQRRKSEEADNSDGLLLRSLQEEICPASPHQSLFLHHNF